jgi:hypothetical protein
VTTIEPSDDQRLDCVATSALRCNGLGEQPNRSILLKRRQYTGFLACARQTGTL